MSEARERANDTSLPLEERMKALEEDPPTDPKDWPADREMRNATFGGSEGDHGYDEGPEVKLGPSGVAHHDDGSVTIDGEPVDDPEQYKGEPVPDHRQVGLDENR
jgi:hypothetical protein